MTISALFRASQALLALFLVSACTTSVAPTVSPASPASVAQTTFLPGSSPAAVPGQAVAATLAANAKSHAQANDVEFDPGQAVRITLNGTSADASDRRVRVDGARVTITGPGTYQFSGTLSDGQVVVDSAEDGKVRLVLDGASIASSSNAAIWIRAADEAVVVLADGSSNILKGGVADGADPDAPNAALFSMANLTIGGTGSLAVTGAIADGITSKDGLVVLGGTIEVDAADDGIRGKDYLIVEGGTITVRSGGDGLKSDDDKTAERGYIAILGGEVTVAASGDGMSATTDAIVGGGRIAISTAGSPPAAISTKGIKAGVSVVIGDGTISVNTVDDAIHSDGDSTIEGGRLTLSTRDDGVHTEGQLTVSGGELTIQRSSEGLEAGQMTLSGGTITIVSTDDGINLSDGTGGGPMGRGSPTVGRNNLMISGGTITVTSDGDGIDANGAVSMTGGVVLIHGPTMQGNGALDADGGIDISGGTLIAAGSAGMAVAPRTTSAQAWVSVSFSPVVGPGSTIEIRSGDRVVATYTTLKSIGSLIVSSDAIAAGGNYDVYVGGTKVETVTAGQHRGGMMPGGRFRP